MYNEKTDRLYYAEKTLKTLQTEDIYKAKREANDVTVERNYDIMEKEPPLINITQKTATSIQRSICLYEPTQSESLSKHRARN